MKQLLKYRIFLGALTFLLLQIIHEGVAQSDTLKSIVNSLKSYSENHFQEKIFVHIDRGVYMTGETLWFKLYLVNAMNLKPADLSKVAYIEILDENHRPVSQKKVSLKNGEGAGAIDLTNGLHSGNYIVRAYTNWMRNYSPEFFFHQSIKVINVSEKSISNIPASVPEYVMGLFPEGGYLVAGITSKLAFKVADKQGKGVDFKGYILDGNNDTLERFSPLKFGMGSITFTPKDSVKYKALITSQDQKKYWVEFPEVLSNGYGMRLTEEVDQKIKVDVSVRSENKQSSYEPVYLIVHKQSTLQFAELSFFQNGRASFIIDKSRLADGINSFTVFDRSKKAVCERLFFNYPVNDRLQLEAKTEKEFYSSREKVELSFSGANLKKEETASLSISVFLNDTLEDEDQYDIFTHLWLSSDLKGFIESPEYYFQQLNKETSDALENLLLTQGWRRFDWTDVFNAGDAQLSFLPEYEGHIIRGRMTDLNNKELLKNTSLYLSSPGKPDMFSLTRSNLKGDFILPLKDLYGLNNLVFQTDPQNPAPSIEIYNCFSQEVSKYSSAPLILSAAHRTSLLDRRVNSSVVKVFNNKHDESKDLFTSDKPFYGVADKVYFLDDYTRFPKMEDVIREYVPEVFLRKKKDGFHFLVSNNISKKVFEDAPLTLIDGVPVFNIEKVLAFDPKKMERLEVVARRYFHGTLNTPGIISYSTYKGDLSGFELDPKALVIEYEGLQMKREFYSPVYNNADAANNRIPDFRNQLFWSSNLKLDGNKKVSVSFCTSDQKGAYTIQINGLSINGKAGSQRLTIGVKSK
ncbi:MAG: hypothetical protein J7604_23255 [Sporocytophaga sp.]|uniref:hypothetical protein n=1 Tax=Sporocytophaga sp. TaxID=2231183 RepID=UPI001AFEEA3F|nr:hypothetical protein [Sporocytophaga sp.]MBO9703151.1 hypothetical protein [Sporocytophaga sp.]